MQDSLKWWEKYRERNEKEISPERNLMLDIFIDTLKKGIEQEKERVEELITYIQNNSSGHLERFIGENIGEMVIESADLMCEIYRIFKLEE